MFESTTHHKDVHYSTDDQWFYDNMMLSPYFLDGLVLIMALLALLFNTLVRAGFYQR